MSLGNAAGASSSAAGDSLGVAVVGCGAIAGVHVPAIQQAPGVRLVGALDRDRARARDLADRHEIGRLYDSWDELLADPAVDVVDVLLPHDLHADYAVAALEAGKHAVVEKPLAPTLPEIDRMIAAARAAGRRLLPCHTRLYEPRAERLTEIVRSGAIGDVYMAQSVGLESPATVGARPWLGGAGGGGGVLMAQAVHSAYLLRWLVGEVEEVSCYRGGRRVVPMSTEDTAVVILRFAGGAVGELLATFAQTVGPYGHSLALYGDRGYASYGTVWQAGRPGLELTVISEELYGDRQPHVVEVPDEPRRGSFQRMWEEFGAAIRGGGPARVTAEDGRSAVEIILAAYRSADEGRPARLPL